MRSETKDYKSKSKKKQNQTKSRKSKVSGPNSGIANITS